MPTARELLLESLDKWRDEVAEGLSDEEKKAMLLKQLAEWTRRLGEEGIEPQD